MFKLVKKMINILFFLFLLIPTFFYAETISPSSFSGSVNIITGQFCEKSEDLHLKGPKEIRLQRIFQKSNINSWIFNHPLLTNDKELENDSIYNYLFEGNDRLKNISIENKEKSKKYCEINFKYETEEKNLTCIGTVQDGRSFSYVYHLEDASRHESALLIDSFTNFAGDKTNYSYVDHPIERTSLLKRIDDPENGYLEIEYYNGKHNNVGGTLISFDNGLRDQRIGRVKLLKAPLGPGNTPIITQAFFYGEGYTDIHYSNDLVERYYYSKEGDITSVETYLDKNNLEKTLYKVENYFWNNSQIVSKTTSNGHGNILSCHTFTYDKNNHLIESRIYGSITGESDELIIMGDQGIPKHHHHEFGSYKFEYDENQRLHKKIEPSGKITEYLYNENNQETAIFIKNSEQIFIRQFFEYNSEGLLIATITDDGRSKEKEDLNYVTERHIIYVHLNDQNPGYGMPSLVEEFYLDIPKLKEVLSKRTIYTYSSDNQISSLMTIGSDGSVIKQAKYNYDLMGRAIYIEEDGIVKTFEYDRCGRKIREAKNVHGEIEEFNFFYDLAGRLIRTTTWKKDNLINSFTYRYDNRNNCTSCVNSEGHEIKYHYDKLNRKIETIYPEVEDENGFSSNPIEKFNYDLQGNVIETIDPRGYKLFTRYNIYKKPLEINYPDGTKEFFIYNLDGTLSKKIHKNGSVTDYQWDILGRLIKETTKTASDQTISWNVYTYNSFHLMESNNHCGQKTEYIYHPLGTLKSVKKGAQDELIEIEYDYYPNGSIYKERCQYGKDKNDGYIKVYIDKNIEIYDLQENLLKIEKFVEKDKKESINENIDEYGNLIQIEKDALGRKKSIKKLNPFGETIQESFYFYDLSNNLVREVHSIFVSNVKKNEYIIEKKFGPGNRLEAIIEGLGTKGQRTTSYHYNEIGLIETIINPDRTLIHHKYNDSGLLYRFYASDSSFDYEYFYDELGNNIAVRDCIHGNYTERGFDNYGRIIFEKLGNGISLSIKYDALGRTTSLCLQDGSSINYLHDSIFLKEISRYSSSNQKLYSHQYINYDLNGNVTHSKMIKNLGDIDYTYANNGFCVATFSPFFKEKLFVEEKNASLLVMKKVVTNLIGLKNYYYGYNSQHELIHEEDENRTNYHYDSFGNRISENDISFNINCLNQIVSDGLYTYEYDINGNLIKKIGKKTEEFFYDALNRLTSIIIDNSVKLTYSYDSLSRRLTKSLYKKKSDRWVQIDFSHYIYHGNMEIGAINSNGIMECLRVLNNENPSEIGSTVALEIHSKIYAPLHDLQGSIASIVDSETAQIIECYQYSAFGKETIFDSSQNQIDPLDAMNPYRFSGKRVDNETGLIYFGKRYYSPELGRWISLDRAGFIDGLNRYAYVHNNPLSNVDHYGLFSFSAFWKKVCSFFSEMKNLISQVVENLSFEKRMSHTAKSKFLHSFETYFGKGFLTLVGYYTHPLESGVYGQSEACNLVRITAINGILNTRDYFAGTLEFLTKIHGGNNIHYVFRPTLGWSNDLLQGLFIKVGFVSSYAKELASTWKKLIDEMGGINSNGKIIHYCHSLGGADTISAASLLTPEERKMIEVISFGSATLISNKIGFQNAKNYVSLRDGVSLFADPFGYFDGIFKKNTNLIFIGSFIGFPLIDHPLAVESYTQTITNLGQVFLNMYANCM